MPNNDALLQKALDAVAALSPDQQREMMELQRRSFAENNVALSRPAPDATGKCGELVDNCDGKEQEAFETWAKSKRFDMHEHPLHYLFLDSKTNAAREGWNEAIRYCRSQAEELLAEARHELDMLKADFDDCNAERARLKADNAAKDAKAKGVEDYIKGLIDDRNVVRERAEALEAKLAAAEKVREAAEHVVWFDWSDNDDDAVKAVSDLRAALDAKPS